ncbi:hypothetical protein [Arthrobacter sp. UYEF21]|uniref:hypothetical protein n=1 Tax=Arthrobacter sp. UYEF21 TaxID=1756364 RepID=UPI003398CD5F
MTHEPDRFSWAVICWTGPAAEAVLATHSGTPVQDAAEWIWALYQAGCSASLASGEHPEPASTDPAVIAVALSVADANWTSIDRIASALTGTALPGLRMPPLSPRLAGHLIGSRTGADIAAAFGIWEAAIAEVKEYRRQAAGMRGP